MSSCLHLCKVLRLLLQFFSFPGIFLLQKPKYKRAYMIKLFYNIFTKQTNNNENVASEEA